MQPNQLHFKTFKSFAIVGTNTTSRSNGIIDPNYHGIVVIPKTFNELPILEIGTYAFVCFSKMKPTHLYLITCYTLKNIKPIWCN